MCALWGEFLSFEYVFIGFPDYFNLCFTNQNTNIVNNLEYILIRTYIVK